eukprot:Gb_32906 [translate_table: standard]
MEAVNMTTPPSSGSFKLSITPPASQFFPHMSRFTCRSGFSGRAPAGRITCASTQGDNAVTLLDYGAGNVRSVRNAIRLLGFDIRDVNEPEDILTAKRLVFPGVGAFAAAMDMINKTGMAEALREYIKNNRPFLGICLGLQLLFEYSEENGPGMAFSTD